jgi:hypothetical protein
MKKIPEELALRKQISPDVQLAKVGGIPEKRA